MPRRPQPWLVRATLQRDRATVVCYHDPAPDVFYAHLAFLSTRYSLVPLRDIAAWVRGEGGALPHRALAVTLDDGWAGNARLHDVCDRFDLTPTVFVCTQVVGTRRRFWFQALPAGAALPAETKSSLPPHT